MKKLIFIQRDPQAHWVGDGFPVRNVFSYNDLAAEMSPFLLLDYAGPREFQPTEQRRGVGSHPHRGFETVSIVYHGEVEHRDSAGGGGKIGPGDVQWMTAASGLVHEEFHGTEYSKRGGPFEMVQLWVNLPKKYKMTQPRYQGVLAADIPQVDLPDSAGTLRVIAGHYQQATNDARGPAQTFSPMNVWDVRLHAGKKAEFTVPDGYTTGVFVLQGKVKFPEGEVAGEAELGLLERTGDRFEIEALVDSKVLILNGQPLNEPIVGHGPFVMNTEAEIIQAFQDYKSGRMGQLQSKGSIDNA